MRYHIVTPVMTMTEDNAMKLTICDSIRELRRARGITQETLAGALGVTAQAVSRWEAGATYPDMELMPSIANYFGISIDRLFGYSGEREAKVSDILRRIDELNDESWREDAGLDECIAILRRALEEFPGNERIMERLALILKQVGWARHHEWLSYGEDGHLRSDFDHHRSNPYWPEAIALFERISADATDRDRRYRAVGELVLMYHTLGETGRAALLAGSMPCVTHCREVLLATAADGAEQTARHAEACIALLNAFRLQLVYGLFGYLPNFDTDAPVRLISGLTGMYELLFSDGNMGAQHAAVCDLYLYLSRLQWERGMHDEAFASLDAALHHARRFDALEPGHRYTAPLVCHAASLPPAVQPGELTRNLPRDWPMWQNPDYAEVAREMQQDARWADWVRRTQE